MVAIVLTCSFLEDLVQAARLLVLLEDLIGIDVNLTRQHTVVVMLGLRQGNQTQRAHAFPGSHLARCAVVMRMNLANRLAGTSDV